MLLLPDLAGIRGTLLRTRRGILRSPGCACCHKSQLSAGARLVAAAAEKDLKAICDDNKMVLEANLDADEAPQAKRARVMHLRLQLEKQDLCAG